MIKPKFKVGDRIMNGQITAFAIKGTVLAIKGQKNKKYTIQFDKLFNYGEIRDYKITWIDYAYKLIED